MDGPGGAAYKAAMGPFRFADEPEHVHIERGDNVAKFWLDPVRLQRSGGFGRAEIGRIQKLIAEHRLAFLEAWHEYFHG